MKISKLLTLNKIDFLTKLLGLGFSNLSVNEYFHLGYLVSHPPLLRGSIAISLHMNFLYDNENSFNFGSPIDTGGIKYGFIDTSIDRDNLINKSQCDFKKFKSLCCDLSLLDSQSLHNILEHKSCEKAIPILSKYFDNEVTSIIYNSNNPHARIFEFSLKNGYELREDHVIKLYLPNTYIHSDYFHEIESKFSGKISYYNPKYGIESIPYE